MGVRGDSVICLLSGPHVGAQTPPVIMRALFIYMIGTPSKPGGLLADSSDR